MGTMGTMGIMGIMGIVGVMGATTTVSAQPEPPASPASGDTVIIIQPGQPAQIVPPAPPGQGPGAAPPAGAQPAPQNESWDNVSHVNGTPVPVGERNDYLIKFRRTNVSINPVGLLMGFYGASISFALNQNIAIRGDVNYINPSDADDSGFTEVGIGVPIYLRRTYQGPFVEPGFISRDWSYGDTTRGPQVLIGWHWSYESGLNLAVALGGGRDLVDDDYGDEDDYDFDSAQFFNGYFRVGYAF
jgi:hypothetical protein